MWLVASVPVAGNLPFRLDDGEFIIGRTKRAQIVISDATVSRQHARITCGRHGIALEDLPLRTRQPQTATSNPVVVGCRDWRISLLVAWRRATPK